MGSIRDADTAGSADGPATAAHVSGEDGSEKMLGLRRRMRTGGMRNAHAPRKRVYASDCMTKRGKRIENAMMRHTLRPIKNALAENPQATLRRAAIEHCAETTRP
jgi:hypothetical protein